MKSSVLEFSHEPECKLCAVCQDSGNHQVTRAFFPGMPLCLCVFVPEYAERAQVHVLEVSACVCGSSVHRNYLMTTRKDGHWMFVVRV